MPATKLRLKTVCTRVEKSSANQENIQLRAVDPTSEENKAFFNATPSAHLNINITNPEAFGSIIENGEYFIDITPAKVANPGPSTPAAPAKV